ncbi:MAG: hypothetical protein U1F50_13285 [Rubrivivax sp.]
MLALVLVANTLRQGSRQLSVPPLAKIRVDSAAVAESLSQAVKAKTVTGLGDPAGLQAALDQHAHLKARYPLVHSKLEREVVGSHGLLFTWKGTRRPSRSR